MGKGACSKLGFTVTDIGIREYQWQKHYNNVSSSIKGIPHTRIIEETHRERSALAVRPLVGEPTQL